MKNGIVSVIIWCAMLLVVTGVLAGCGSGETQVRDAVTGRAENRGFLLAQFEISERDVIRVRTDLARGRLWVLGLDNVYVYDFATRRLLRKISLSNWSVSRYDCKPDLALDRSGSAWISSNAQSRLWRIDGGNFAVSEREIRLQGREHWEVGFGALAFDAGGALFAMTATAGGLLWKVDVNNGGASLVDLGAPQVARCEFPDLFAAIAAAKGVAQTRLAGKQP